MHSPSIHLVSGFLGSGKTLFLQQLLQRPIVGSKSAVIVNDFGDTVLDSFVLRRQSVDLVELPGGCLCCSAIDNFREVFEMLLAKKPARIFIEATGLADIGDLRSDLAMMGRTLHSTFCVVDAVNIFRLHDQFTTVASQIESADFLLIAKSDLPEAKDFTRITGFLRELNSRAIISQLQHGRLPNDVLVTALGSASHYQPQRSERSQHLFRDHIGVFRIRLPRKLKQSELDEALARLPASVVRVKGVVRIDGMQQHPGLEVASEHESTVLVNYVCGRSELSRLPADEAAPRHFSLFVIGFKLARAEIARAIEGLSDADIEEGRLAHTSDSRVPTL